jgi:transcriptional regulator with XRE-family HTH domain
VWINQQDYKKVGERLAALRRDVGITQAQFAKRIGKPQSFVSSYESGQRRIDIVELVVLAAAFEVDPTKVFQTATGVLGSRKVGLRKIAKPGRR